MNSKIVEHISAECHIETWALNMKVWKQSLNLIALLIQFCNLPDYQQCHYHHQYHYTKQQCHHHYLKYLKQSYKRSTSPQIVVQPSSSTQVAIQPSTSTQASTSIQTKMGKAGQRLVKKSPKISPNPLKYKKETEFDRCVQVIMTHYYLDNIIFDIFLLIFYIAIF